MKEIGGYFELELARKSEYHHKAIHLNSGRNAFKYILTSQNIQKVYIPSYICDSIVEPLQEAKIEYEFYNIDKNFEIVNNITLQANERILYANYFAMKNEYIEKLVKFYKDKLIIDNTQAFFELPMKNIDTVYSPRKFFGVSDGGYLYSNVRIDEKFIRDESFDFTSQLIGRIERNASNYYDQYQEAEQRLVGQPIKAMSAITSKILNSIDYENIKQIRERNFYFLHSELKRYNLLKISSSESFIPFVYPLLIDFEGLREKLIDNKIYIAKYWNEVLTREKVNADEVSLVNNLLPLPIDQRYNLSDMRRIVNIIKEYYE